MSGHRTIMLVVALVVVFAVGWLFVRMGNDGSSVRETHPKSNTSGWKHKLSQRGISESRESQEEGLVPQMAAHSAPEAMPMRMRRRIAEVLHGVGALHLQFNKAQRGRTPVGVDLWIVEGRGVTCLFLEETLASSCRTRVEARRQGIWLETYKISKVHPEQPSHFLALGAVPDGVHVVPVTIAGSPRAVRVRKNVWAIRAETPIEFRRMVH